MPTVTLYLTSGRHVVFNMPDTDVDRFHVEAATAWANPGSGSALTLQDGKTVVNWGHVTDYDIS